MLLNCVSINIQGLRQHWKKLYLNKFITDQKIDILLIQETHFPANAVNPWRLWRNEFHIVEGRADKCSQGTAILIRSSISPNNIQILINNSRLTIVQIQIQGTLITVVNLYNALGFRANEYHINKIYETLLSLRNQENILIMGDFNRQQPTLGKWNKLFNTRLSVVDLASSPGRHPQYTHITKSSCTTIDYCWLSNHMLPRAILSYLPNGLSDHVALVVTIELQASTQALNHTTNSFYFPHPALPNSIDVVNEVYIATAPMLTTQNLTIQDWNVCKKQISRTLLHANRAFNLKIALQRQFYNLITTSNDQIQTSNTEMIIRLKEQYREIEKLDEIKTRYMMSKRICEAGQNFPSLLKTPLFKTLKVPNYVSSLRVGDAVLVQMDMASALNAGLVSQFGNPPQLESPLPRMDLSLSTTSSNISALLNSYVNLMTVTRAIGSLNRHAPSGPSAITANFLNRFSYIFPRIFTPLYKIWMTADLDQLYSLKIDSFTICFDKRKRDDGVTGALSHPAPAGLGDVRPITIEDTEAKVYARILYNILIEIYRDMIHPSQFCLAGRSIHDAIHLLHDLHRDFRNSRRQAPVVLFVDIAKAFDNVDHSYLIQRIYTQTDNPLLANAIRNYLEHKHTSLKWRNRVFQRFHCLKGVSQGSPVSSLLFAIYLDELLHLLDGAIPGIYCRTLGRNIRSLAYADDLAVFCEDMEEVDVVLELLDDVGKRTGLTLNRSKTAAYNLHNFQPIPDFSPARLEKFLGMPMPLFSHEARIKIQSKIISAFKTTFFSLANTKLSLKIKVKVVNCYCVPKINYFAPHVNFPQNFITQLNSLITKFLWVRCRCVISRRAMYFHYKLGGLSLFDIKLFNRVLRANAFVKWTRYLDLHASPEVMPTDTPPPWTKMLTFGRLHRSWRDFVDDFPNIQQDQKLRYRDIRDLAYTPDQVNIRTLSLVRVPLMIEKTLVSSNIVDFVYKLIHFKLPTNLLLTQMGILQTPATCPMCTLHIESVDHLLCSCCHFARVRAWMAAELGIDATPFPNIYDLMCAFIDRKAKLRILLYVLFLFWRTRCFLVFNQTPLRIETYVRTELKQLFQRDRQVTKTSALEGLWPFSYPVPDKWKFLL